MNTFQLSCFVEVAATLNFSQAARNLGVSQPTVSHNIKALEDELGCTLVSRSTRTVSFTDEGMQYLSYAHDILDLAARGARLVSHQRDVAAPVLRIGAHGGVEALAIAPALRAFSARQPEVMPNVVVRPHSALVNMLEGGTLDVALEYRDPSGTPAGATVFRRIVDAPAACLCAPDHPLAAREALDVADLRDAGPVAVCNPYASLAAIDALQRRVIMALEAEHVVMCSSVEGAMALAAAGRACTVMPAVPAPRGAELRVIPVSGLPKTVFGVRVRRGRLAQATGDFIAALAEEVGA